MSKENEKFKMREVYPPIITFQLLQEIQAHFCALNQFNNTPKSIWEHIKEEIVECREAVEVGDRAEIKGELADILIFAATAANIMYFDLEKAMQHSLKRISNETSTRIATAQSIQKRSRNRRTLYEVVNYMMESVQSTQPDREDNKLSVIRAITHLCIGVVDIANNYDISIEEALSQKLTRNYKKYNPHKRRQLIMNGLNPGEAYITQKSKWDRSQDKRFLE